MMWDDGDDDIPATQPVLSVLLQDVVAYVEVRSGHDNRSRGVKAQLRNLGATVQDVLTKDVTHVVFNEGLPSTYKKAKKLNCHLVSVLWIEACKEALCKVGEAGYPPIGQQIYENPRSLKNFKKLKSMQPDFDDEVAEIKTDKIRKQIQRRAKAVPVIEEHAEQDEPVKKNQRKELGAKRNTAKKTNPSTNAKASRKKRAFQEITSGVVNTMVTTGKEDVPHTSSNNVENVNSVVRTSPQRSSSSSSSVIFCGVVDEAGPSTRNFKKKHIDNTPISRADFVDGLNVLVRSLSKEKQGKTHEMSPWRKPFHVAKGGKGSLPLSNPSPRRSPRYCANALRSLSETEAEVVPKKNTTKSAAASVRPPACTSASATLLQRRKVAPVPSSPGDDFVLLSQEPGDMPSIDELARMQRRSVRAGDERITLSQVIKSYKAVAEQQQKSSELSGSTAGSQSSRRSTRKSVSCSVRSTRSSSRGDSSVNAEDVSFDAGVVVPSQNNCPSEAGSTASSFSTTVLVNGMPPNKAETRPICSEFLPGSEEMDFDEISNEINPSSAAGPCPVEEHERQPSPIFVIRKPKVKKPFKSQTVKANVSAQSSSSTAGTEDGGDISNTEKKSKEGSAPVNPVDYINNFFLPRFTLANKTPAYSEKILVEETPDIMSVSAEETSPIIIPPTPAENVLQTDRDGGMVSPTNSLANSVISWVKRSCKVPLFSSRASKTQEPPKPEEVADNSSENNIISTKRGGLDSSVPPVKNNSDLASKDKTSFSGASATSVENVEKPQISRRSPRNQQIDSSKSPERTTKLRENEKKTGSKGDKKNAVSDEKKSRSDCTNKLKHKLKTKGKLETPTIEDEDSALRNEEVNTKAGRRKTQPLEAAQNKDDDHPSSGYESSLSERTRIHETRKSSSSKSSNEPSVRGKKINELLVPVNEVPKKRSDIYETDGASVTPIVEEIHNGKNPSHHTGRRKRHQSVPNVESIKKQKLNDIDSQDPCKVKATRISRADSKGLLDGRSQSDLTMDISTSSRGQLSVGPKKRMATSLTRNPRNNAPKVIVCTFLTASEQNAIEAAGGFLEGWRIEDKVTSRTTHVINSGPKRTLNMLKGMARGCWLVNQKWMLDSSKAGYWLEEEKYELVEFSPAVKQCRRKRQAIGKDFKHTLFSRAGPIFVSPKTEGPPAKDIRELLDLSGATLTSSQEAKIVIGEDLSKKGHMQCVQPLWVLDCLTKNKVLSVGDVTYRLK